MILTLAAAFSLLVQNQSPELDNQFDAGLTAGVPTTDTAGGPAGGLTAEFNVDTKKSRVALEYGFRFSYGGEYDRASRTRSLRYTSFTTTFGAPISTGDDDFTSLNALYDAFSIEAELTHFRVPRVGHPSATALRAIDEIFFAECIKKRQAAGEIATQEACQEERDNDFSGSLAKYLSSDQIRAYQADIFPIEGRIYYFGLRGGIGHEVNKFLDATSFASTEQTDVPMSASAFAGVVFPASEAALTLGFSYQERFKDQKSLTICDPPAIAGGPQECRTGAVGAPEQIDSTQIFVEGRRAFNLSDRDMAIGLRVTQDLDEGETEADAQLYFIQSTDNAGLNGGLRLRWDSEDDEIVAGFFFSSPFRLMATP